MSKQRRGVFASDNPRSTQKPVEEARNDPGLDGIMRTHPAFGAIAAARGTHGPGGVVLFGSPIKAGTSISIRISFASEFESLHHVRHFEEDRIVEVLMSEAQWAAFVSSLNVGSGVPCTILAHKTGDLDPFVPSIDHTPFEERMAADIARSAAERIKQYQEAVDALDAWVKGGMKGGKAEGDRIRKMFLHPVDYARQNAEFMANSMTEHVENAVTAAKAEVAAYVTSMSVRYPQLGVQATVAELEDKRDEEPTED